MAKKIVRARRGASKPTKVVARKASVPAAVAHETPPEPVVPPPADAMPAMHWTHPLPLRVRKQACEVERTEALLRVIIDSLPDEDGDTISALEIACDKLTAIGAALDQVFQEERAA